MPWKEESTMSLRKELVSLASQKGANVRQLSGRFGVSPTTAYKWMKRYRRDGITGLRDQSRRPQHSPRQCGAEIEAKVVKAREENPAWGARKIAIWLKQQGETPPSSSTVHAILKRRDRIDPVESAKHQPWQRFQREAPNQLWQMDFKGHFPLGNGKRCHPLTVVDDHSRYAVGLQACPNEQGQTVQQRLTGIFRRYGLPEQMLVDNGSPWGDDPEHPYTVLTVWLLRLGIGVTHSRPYHPQTLGKGERFHRTLKAEVLQAQVFADFEPIQQRFDQWRCLYNHQRPHQALEMAVPASRYQLSPRSFPEPLPSIEYGPHDQVRKVQIGGHICFQNREFRISKAFRGYPVALRPTLEEEVWEVFFCTHPIAQIHVCH